MDARLYRYESFEAMPMRRWDTAFVGTAIDQRGKEARKYAESAACRVIEVDYDPMTLQMHVDGVQCETGDLATVLREFSAGRILLEATTLEIAEMALLSRYIRRLNPVKTILDFLYVEPRFYAQQEGANPGHRTFSLSEEVVGYRAVPTFGRMLDPNLRYLVVFFLGYEGERLARCFEEVNVSPERCQLVFGSPPYVPGWETNSFHNNINVMRDQEMHAHTKYCPADNPIAAVDILENMKKQIQEDDDFFVAPIGNKPHGIGAVAFLLKNPQFGLLFDHPQRRVARSEEVGAVHLYCFTL